MKILVANKFFYPKGGPEIYLKGLTEYQQRMGHEIAYFSMKHPDNWQTDYEQYFVEKQKFDKPNPFFSNVRTAFKVVYSLEAANKIEKLIKTFKPGIAHVHSIYHQISPSILQVLKKYDIPVVMTLHDYKLVCPNMLLFRDCKICEECRGSYFYRAVINKCVKGSRLASLICAIESTYHRLARKYIDNVDVFISPSNALKNKFVEFGFPGEKIKVVNNFFTPSIGSLDKTEEDYILAAGRISPEKGYKTLIKAMQGNPDIILKIAGDGPELQKIVELKQSLGLQNVELLGFQSKDKLNQLMANCRFFVIPSEGYENAPLVILEAFSFGKPVIGSNLGGIAELITDDVTGTLFRPGDHIDLSNKIKLLWEKPDKVLDMGKNAKKASNFYNIENHYKEINKIYNLALERP